MWRFNVAALLMLVSVPALFALGAHPPDWSDPLARHHIPHTKRALIAALRNDDAQVRQAAAGALANGWPKDAIPAIKEAMFRENIPGNRESLAFDLARLGDATGRDTLTSICHNSAEPKYRRMSAAMDMSYLKDDSCVDVVLDVLQLDSDPENPSLRIQALELVPTFIGRLDRDDSRKVVELVIKALEDPEPGVRIRASNTLGLLGDVSAIPSLQVALAKEKDEARRFQMSIDLQKLEKVKRSQ